jgi:hypothetical protein
MIKNLEIVNFKNYEPNLDRIQRVFGVFDECIQTLETLRIEYAVTGSIGLILNTNKIYRSIKDVDFIVREPLYHEQLSFFLKNGFEYRDTTFNTFMLIKNFVTIEFHSKYLRLSNVIINSKKIQYNTHFINVISIEDIFSAKKLQGKLRQKDLEDIEFYSQFV